MEKCIEVFREDIFYPEKRDKINEKLITVFKTELPAETLSKFSQNQLEELSERVLQSLTIVMEFMDKGIKGLLSGDVTLYMLQSIESSLEKHHSNLLLTSNDLEQLLLKQEEANKIRKMMENMKSPSKNKFYTQSNEKFKNSVYLPDIGIDVPMTTNQQSSAFTTHIDEANLERLQARYNLLQEGLSQDISKKKTEINTVINSVYNEVLETAFGLDKYRIPYYGIKYPERENPINLFQRQLKIEELSFELSHAKYKSTLESLIKIGKADQLASSHRIVLHWLKSIQNAVQEQQRIFLRRSSLDNEKGKPSFYILQMPSDKIASICVMHLMKTLFRQFIRDLGDPNRTDSVLLDLTRDFSAGNVKTPAITLFSDLGDLFSKELKNHITSSKRRGGITDKIEKHLLVEDSQIGVIPKHTQLKIGAFLTNIMCKNLKYSVGRKRHLLLRTQVLRQSRTKEIGYVLFNKSFIENFISEIDKVHDLNIHVERSLPMIYKPAPWKNINFGAYYLKQTKMAKVMAHFKEANNLLRKGDLSEICNTLNVVSEIKWRVNKHVLEMIEYIWSIGGGLGEIPKRFNERPITAELFRKAKFKDKLRLIKEHQRNMETHALRCEFLLRLSIAQSFKNVNTLYFPHNIDFRGRAYPIPPHLNHMGADISRGILEFAEGEALGKEGFYWLKVHLANVMGKDKLPFNDRVKYVDSIINVIHRCAEDPRNSLEWIQSENPWQTLAVMREVSLAQKSGSPEDYVTN